MTSVLAAVAFPESGDYMKAFDWAWSLLKNEEEEFSFYAKIPEDYETYVGPGGQRFAPDWDSRGRLNTEQIQVEMSAIQEENLYREAYNAFISDAITTIEGSEYGMEMLMHYASDTGGVGEEDFSAPLESGRRNPRTLGLDREAIIERARQTAIDAVARLFGPQGRSWESIYETLY